MADANTMGGGRPVAVKIEPNDRRFLLYVFTMARDGIRDELKNHPEQLREPRRLHREEAVYDRLIAALEGDPIVPDADLRQVVTDLAEMIDRENEHDRVVAEHKALHRLLGQLLPKGGGRQRM